MLVRLMWGCRISLLVAFAASLTSLFIGVLWGATAAYAGGKTDELMMRFVDVLFTIPLLVVACRWTCRLPLMASRVCPLAHLTPSLVLSTRVSKWGIGWSHLKAYPPGLEW